DLGMIDLDAGLVLRGRVIDRRDRGLPDVRVEVFAAGRDGEVPVTQTTTDGQGRFLLPPLAAGPYLLRAFGRRLLVSQEVSLEPAGAESPVILVSDGVFVRGRVHRRGEPVGGGSVLLRSAL